MCNNTGIEFGHLSGKYPGRVGHLYSPGAGRTPFDYVPYALDNGAYVAFDRGIEWDEDAFAKHLAKYRFERQKPLWLAVPDAVGDRLQTLERWMRWEPILRPYGWPLAFCVQDGMKCADVPASADVVFVGGSVEWKWKTAMQWANDFSRVHVGKVNSYEKLWYCDDAGVESVDGTGWFRGDKNQNAGLWKYLAEASNERKREQERLYGSN